MRISLPEPAEFATLFAAITSISPDPLITGICSDSRECRPGDLYLAIRGEQVDGHRFLPQISASHGAGALVDTLDDNNSLLSQYRVNDPVKTIGEIGRRWRQQFDFPVVAITGSNGKTTTKELLAHLLGGQFAVHRTRGNFNTSVGLPLTLLEMAGNHQLSILELGANHPGDIAYLTGLAHPTHGLITNIAPAHLEGFGTIEKVVQTKGELFAGLAEGTCFVNIDDPRIGNLPIPGRSLTYGFGSKGNFYARPEFDAEDQPILIINGRRVTLPTTNPVFARNLLAATAVAVTLGLEWNDLQERLTGFEPPSGRARVLQNGQVTIIDDSYNANLNSVRAGLEYLQTLPARRRILVFGDMFELGDAAEDLHRQVGEAAATAGIDALFTVGPLSRSTNRAAAAVDTNFHFDDKAELTSELNHFVQSGDALLVKGSRGMAMETIIENLDLN